MKETMLICDCGNDEFVIKIITDQRMENNPNTCDTYVFYCTECDNGKVVRYESGAKQDAPGI